MNEIADTTDPFNARFSQCQRQLYRFVVALLPDRDAAEEAFQQTCCVLLDTRDKYDPQRDFMAWACGVARNVVRAQRRAQRKSPLELSDALLEQLAETQEQSSCETDGRLAALGTCLQKLPRKQRQLLDRCYMGNETIRAVAITLKLAPATLYKRLDRIRWKLLDCVEKSTPRKEQP